MGYDARNSGHNPHASGPRDDPAVEWTSLGDRPVYPPVIGDDLYSTEAWTDGRAVALSAADGSTKWTNGDLPPMRWAPALHEDRLLVLTREEGNVVGLHALDLKTGTERWVQREGITASSVGSPPVGPTVRDDTLYVASDRGIVACDARTGAVEWTAELSPDLVEKEGGRTWDTTWRKLAVTADRAFTFDANDSYRATREVYAVDRATGDREWTAELAVGDRWSLKGDVVAGDHHVYVSALESDPIPASGDSEWSGEERLIALEADSGAVVRNWSLPGKTLGPPAYADGTLYVGEWLPDSDGGRLDAVDAADGSVTWTYETGAGAVLSPTVAGDTVYVNQGDAIVAVERGDGTRRWRVPVGDRAGAPVVVGDTAYVRTNPGRDEDSRLLAIR